MKISGEEFPDRCPENCPGSKEPFGQSSICVRCPIFNCVGPDPLLSPDEYRKDWARIWKKWFDEGMRGLPGIFRKKEKS